MTALDCLSCGACCIEAGSVPLWSDDHVPTEMTRDGDYMAKEVGGRCVALQGTVGAQCKCGIYYQRPGVCERFQVGSEGCLRSREIMFRKLSQTDRKYRGYGPRMSEINPEVVAATPAEITIDYINWRGERSTRRILPKCIMYGSTKWHPNPGWLLEALDCEKSEFRLFAISDIKSVSL